MQSIAKLLTAIATLLTHPLICIGNPIIENSTLNNSPVLIGNQNTINQITNINSRLPPNALGNISSSTAALEATSSNLMGIIDYFSEKNSEDARSQGNPRLSADIEKKRIKAIEDSKINLEKLPSHLINLAEIEATYDVPNAIATLDKAIKIEPLPSEAILKKIHLQIRYHFLTDSAASIEVAKNNLESLNLIQRYTLRVYDFIQSERIEQFDKSHEKALLLSEEFFKLPENLKIHFAEDTSLALALAIQNQYSRIGSTQSLTKSLFEIVKLHFSNLSGNAPVVKVYGNYGIQLHNDEIIFISGVTEPLKPIETKTPSASIISDLLKDTRKLTTEVEKVELELIASNLSEMSLSEKRLALEKTNRLLNLFPNCTKCPISIRAKISKSLIENRFHLTVNEGAAAYISALDALAETKNLALQTGPSPLLKRLDAINFNALGKARIQLSNNIAEISPFPATSALDAAAQKIDEIEKSIGSNLYLTIFKARIFDKIAKHHRSIDQPYSPWIYCSLLLETIKPLMRIKPVIDSIKHYYIDCASRRLELLAFKQSSSTTAEEELLQRESFEFFDFLETNQIELSDFGVKWADSLKKKISKILNSEGI